MSSAKRHATQHAKARQRHRLTGQEHRVLSGIDGVLLVKASTVRSSRYPHHRALVVR